MTDEEIRREETESGKEEPPVSPRTAMKILLPEGMELPEGVELPEIPCAQMTVRRFHVGEDGRTYGTEETIDVPVGDEEETECQT